MDKTEAEFMAKLLGAFRVEAEEHLKKLSDGLLQLEGEVPEQNKKALVEGVFREAHSLKGAARSVNHDAIQSVCQSLENVLAAWKKGTLHISRQLFDTIYATLDLLGKLIALQPGSETEEDRSALIILVEKFDQLLIAKQENAHIAAPLTPVEIPKSSATPYASKSPTQEQTDATHEAREDNIKSNPSKEAVQPKATQEIAEIFPKEAPKKTQEQVAQTNKKIENSHRGNANKSPEHSKSNHETLQNSGQAYDKTIRVSLAKMDKVFQEVEEMLMLKLAARQQVVELKEIQTDMKEWEKKWTRMTSNINLLRGMVEEEDAGLTAEQNEILKSNINFIDWQQQFIKSLKENLNQLIKKSSQEYRLACGTVDVLLDDTRKVLMQPFSTLLDVFPRMVRDISHAQGKEVRLEVQGGAIEVDRRILEEMKDPLIHVFRNCIDHGLEEPNTRTKANKPAQGSIKIAASQVSGNSMEILIADDGRGINRNKVKEVAVKQGILSAVDAAALSDQDTLMLIFQSGISTNSIITDLSGRGLGLGIVSEKVEKLGGQIFVESKDGEGSTFRIVLPLTLATFRGIQVKAADQDFILPSHNIKRIIRIKTEEIKSVENREMISIEGKAIAFIPLKDVLQIFSKDEQNKKPMIFAVIVKSADKTVAFGVDQVISEQEVLVKGLGSQLKRLKNILAATITESGKVIPILNPQDIVKASVKTQVQKRQEETVTKAAVDIKKKTVLLAEDSITSRMLLKNILETAGYKVKTAVDGMEALSLFKIENFDLIMSDVDMPRMDGFELASKVRGLDKGKKIPIVLCTARETLEDKEHGIEVGANAYLEKSRFTQSNLIEIIQKLV